LSDFGDNLVLIEWQPLVTATTAIFDQLTSVQVFINLSP